MDSFIPPRPLRARLAWVAASACAATLLACGAAMNRVTAIGGIDGQVLTILVIHLTLIFAGTGWIVQRKVRAIEGFAAQSLQRERELAAVAAHEMRTPLAGLRIHAQLALRATSAQQSAESLRLLMTGIDQTSRLLDQLLDAARSDGAAAGDTGLREPVHLPSVYQHVMADLEAAACERDLVLKTSFDADHVHGVEHGVQLLMRNLLGNAIRYTPRGGRIDVRSTRHDGAVSLTIDDSGPGIPQARRAEAFERFNRLGRADTQGSGLGLAIVQSVATAHDAAVRLMDSPLGGLRVEVRFPSIAGSAAHSLLRAA